MYQGTTRMLRNNGLVIIDINDPTNPQQIGRFDTYDAYGVYVSGNYAYVASYFGLVIIDISDPTNPQQKEHLDTNGYAYDVYVSGSYAYVAYRENRENGLVIIDISDLTNPQKVGHYDTNEIAWGVYVSGNYAYVADGFNGLVIIDISDPTNPRQIGRFDTNGRAYGVYVSGNYAYVADGENGLVIIDITNPTNPVLVNDMLWINLKTLTSVSLANVQSKNSNQDSNIEWQKCLGGSEDDVPYSIQQTKDGGYIIAGGTYSNDVDVRGNHGGIDGWVVKLDEEGNIEWQKCLGGSEDDGAHSVQQTKDGGYIIVGGTYSNDGDVKENHGGYDFWIVKLDNQGNILWQKTLGGSEHDIAHSIQQTKDGGYIVAGWTESNDGDVKGNHGGSDFWIVKLDNQGNILWQKTLGGSEDDEAHSIQQTKDSGYIVAGRTIKGYHGGYDFWIVKLDNQGNILWQKTLGGSEDDEAHSIQQTKDGGYIIVGGTYSNDGDVRGNHGGIDGWVVKLDEEGNIEWQKCLGGSEDDAAHSIQQTKDGGCIIVGGTYSNDGDVRGNHGGIDGWIVKLRVK